MYKHQGLCEDLVKPGSWASANWECETQWQSCKVQVGLNYCPQVVVTTPYGSTAPSLQGSVPCCEKETISTISSVFLRDPIFSYVQQSEQRRSTKRNICYLQTGLGAGPNPDGLQSGKEVWQINERTAGLHSILSPSSSVHQLWTRYSCMSSGSEREVLKKTSESSRRMVRHTSPRYALQ